MQIHPITTRRITESRERARQSDESGIIDTLNFRLIKQRTKIVKHMLSLKRYKSEIIDKKRMNEVFRHIKKKSIKEGIDPKITSRIWKAIIWAYVNFQKRNFKTR